VNADLPVAAKVFAEEAGVRLFAGAVVSAGLLYGSDPAPHWT
jgi:hypothetical protein